MNGLSQRASLALLVSCMALVVVGCGVGRRVPPNLDLDLGGMQFFLHHIVTQAAPGGRDCCSDVASLGDVNRDGYLDVLIGSEGADGPGLVWYEYPTWARHDIGSGEFTTDGEFVDFDGDGDLDVIIGDLSAGVTWFEREEHEDAWLPHVLAPGYVHDLEVADVNGDGIRDVLATDKHQLVLLLSQAPGEWAKTVLLEREGEGLELIDLDGDGDLDILFSNMWLENVGTIQSAVWQPRELAPAWVADTRTQAADINKDGRLDVILTASEGEGQVAWFEPPDPASGGVWTEHLVAADMFEGVHSLRVSDFDLDGDLDILIAEMHTSHLKRVVLFLQGPNEWAPLPLARHGSHNMVAGDIDGDGDIDIVGKNYAGAGRFVEYWENRAADLHLVPAALATIGPRMWRYDPIDSTRPGYDRKTFGLVTVDIDADGDEDVVAGGTLYVNPGSSQPSEEWRRIAVAPGADVIAITPYSYHGWRSLVAVDDDELLHVFARDAAGQAWAVEKAAGLPYGRTQGWTTAVSGQDGSMDVYFTRSTNLFMLSLPARASSAANSWILVRVAMGVQEEAVARGDIDDDGDDDLVAVDGDGKAILWLERTADKGWLRHRLGASLNWIDRLEIADINTDGRPDIVFTEETRNLDYDARVGWLQAPPEPASGIWLRHTIVMLRSANSLDVLDVDSDGDPDVVVAEHTDFDPDRAAPDNFTGIFMNQGAERWVVDVIDIGPRSSHLGAKVADLDGDGTAEVISIGYGQSCCVHRWTRSVANDPVAYEQDEQE